MSVQIVRTQERHMRDHMCQESMKPSMFLVVEAISSSRCLLDHRKETAATRQHGHLLKLCWNKVLSHAFCHPYSRTEGVKWAFYFTDSESKGLKGKRFFMYQNLQ